MKAPMRIINVRVLIINDILLLHTNYTSKMRMLIVNFDAAGKGKCIERASKSVIVCLNLINRTIDVLELNEIELIRHAAVISITAIPILYRSGARPTHLITLRRTFITENG